MSEVTADNRTQYDTTLCIMLGVASCQIHVSKETLIITSTFGEVHLILRLRPYLVCIYLHFKNNSIQTHCL